MSSKVDDRIVNMKFNNAQFEKGVADTAQSLETLKKGLTFQDVGKGLTDFAKNGALTGIASGVQTIADKFSALSVIGITALANIANKAVDAGLTLAKSLTIDPIKAGFDEYELKMGSIQTILANTARYGTDLKQVTSNLDELNAYADKTIYNFGDMTKNIGLFTNAGIRIEDATAMIKGFSNEAAASGTNAQGAAGAAYQLSQALSAGTIRLMDWRSLTNVGMGNKNMQNGLIEIADAMGTLTANSTSATEVQADFNGSLEKNWLSADVMSTYLKIMSQDTKESAYEMAKAAGLSDSMAESLSKQAVTANEAATKVRSWTQLVGTMQESVGSGWAQTFDILIGDFEQATELWTNVNNALGPIIDGMSKARNDLLEGWAAGGGRESVINSVANAWHAAVALVTPIKEAFQEIFPPMTAQKLIDITKAVEDFTKKLMPSQKTIDNLKSTFKGLFAVMDIGWMVLQQIIGLFGRLFGAVAPASGGILEMSGNLGDWLVSVRDAIKSGEGLTKVFDWLGDVGEKIIGVFVKMGDWISDTLSVDGWANAWENVGKAFQTAWEWMQPFFDWIGDAYQKVKKVIQDTFQSLDFGVLVGLLGVGAAGGLAALVGKLIATIKNGIGVDLTGGFLDSIKNAFDGLTSTFETMQGKLKSEILIKIATAIAILAGSLLVLSFIEPERLVSSLTAIALGMGILLQTMNMMDKALTGKEVAKMGGLAAVMIILSTAILIFAAAMAVMATLSWDEIARGLVGLAGGLVILVKSLELMSKNQAKMIVSATAIMILSGAIVVLAAALKIVGSLSWDEIIRGLSALGGALAIVAAASKLAQSSAQGAAAMFIISAALMVLGSALLIMAKMDWDAIGRSLVTLAGSLFVMAIGVQAMQGSIAGAAAMAVVSVGLLILSAALKEFAKLSWDEIGRVMVVMAGSLAILAGAMALMGIPIVLLGAVGIIAASAAMMMLAPALLLLGTMSWDAIGRGLTMLAGGLVIIAAGGLLLIPAIPGLLALGAAAALIGIGAFAAGAGMLMFSAGFIALTGAAAVGSEQIKIAVMTLIELIPAAMAAFAQGIIDFALVIAQGGVEFTAAMITLLQSLITAIQTMAPQIINVLWDLLMQMADKLAENVPILVERGGDLIIGVLNGMESKVPGIATAGTNLMIALMRAISNEVPRLADEGAKAIIRLVNGISTAIDNNSEAMGRAGGRLASAIIRGMVNGIGGGVDEVISAARNMANKALSAAMKALGINSPSKEFFKLGAWSTEGFANALYKTSDIVDVAATSVGNTALDATKKALANISSEVATDIDMSPTIRPVLDLTNVKRDASLMNNMLTPPSLTLNKSVAYAEQARSSKEESDIAAIRADMEAYKAMRNGDVIFNQTNNSPKALSEAELYRRTNNQLSVAKKELTTTDG